MPADGSPEKFGLVIPTLNEVGNMAPLIQRVEAALAPTGIDYELLVVDDDSTDGTPELVQQYAQTNPRIRLLRRVGQKGLAGAIIHGWNHTDANWLGVIDADLQHPPETLPALVTAMRKGSDIAVASRYASSGTVGNWNAFRHFVSRCSTMASMPLQKKNGVQVKDPMSGFFIVRRECIDGLDLTPFGFKILLEILVKGRIRNAVEVPFTFATRHSGRSKADFKVALHYFSLLGKLSREVIFGPGQQ